MATWTLIPFDWQRYRRLAPELKDAARAGDLSRIRNAEAAQLVATLEDTTDLRYTCNYILCELCTVGDPLNFHGTFPAVMRQLSSLDNGEDIADKLVEGAFAGMNVEDWFKCDHGLMGILTWADLDRLRPNVEALIRTLPHRDERRLRNLTRLLRLAQSEDELVEGLLRLIEACNVNGWGLAFLLYD